MLDTSYINDFKVLEELSAKDGVTQRDIFAQIGILDRKHENNIEYKIEVNGILCDIGNDLRKVSILKCAVKRMKKLLKLHDDAKLALEHEWRKKLMFYLGSAILNIAEIENPHPYSIEKLISSSKFNDARRYFDKVSNGDYFYPHAIVNSSNILEKYGRNLESIKLYDDALRINPNFGMALANIAISIEHYTKLAPSVSLRLLSISLLLLERALLDKKIEEIGGIGMESQIKEEIKRLSFKLQQSGYDAEKIDRNDPELNKYQQFCLDNNLFLNYDFGFCYDGESIIDSFFPVFIQHVEEEKKISSEMSDRIYFSFSVFNEILESYATSRLAYFNAFVSNHKELDDAVRFINTYSDATNGHKYGILKSTIVSLHSCLDKIGHLLYYYYVGKSEDKNISFRWLTWDKFTDLVTKENNFHLLALHGLAVDFSQGNKYRYLSDIRNKIVHSFLNIHADEVSDVKDQNSILEGDLHQANMELFFIVKTAVMYAMHALGSQKISDRVLQLKATYQRDMPK